MKSASMNLTAEHLQKLLEEDLQDRRRQEQEATQRSDQKGKELQSSLHAAWQPLGSWIRPIPDHLYQCPLSAPQTTLVAWSSLPHSVRSKLPEKVRVEAEKRTLQKDGGDLVVEVPLAYIQIDEEGMADAGNTNSISDNDNLLKKRPVGGNLTNKLSEYTRGVAGQCRPFRAGGLDAQDNTRGSREDEIDDFLSDCAVQKALQVLERGSEASWKDGTILTAPPGVDFQVGLSWEKLYGSETTREGENVVEEEGDDNDVSNLVDDPPLHSPMNNDKPASATQFATSMWTASDFLDDDSLFGSSDGGDSESSSEEEDVVIKKKKKGVEKLLGSDSDEENEKEQDKDDSNPGKEAASLLQETVSAMELENVSTDPNEVDELLLELSIPTAIQDLDAKKKENPIAKHNNPLELAERQSQDQQDSTRKEWASTKLLPIDDINAWIPNPAMSFPFTLDGFQQQAIVRLERNESVFVAAHTSAGMYQIHFCCLQYCKGTLCDTKGCCFLTSDYHR